MAGSTLFYTITYSDYTLGSVCSSTVVPASSCNSGICRHVFDVTDSSCPTVLAYNISVAASNLIGSGYPSRVTLSIGTDYEQCIVHGHVSNYYIIILCIGNGTNLFISVIFNFLYDQVTCSFIDQELSSEKTCSISLYRSEQEFCSGFQNLISKQSVTTMHSITVVIGLDSPSTKEDKYCFILTASNETFAAIVEGMINAGM